MTLSSVSPGPAPEPTAISAPYWAAATEGRLLLQKCTACGRLQHYPRPHCTACLGVSLEWVTASGDATVYSYTVVRRAASKAFEGQVPYVLAIIELAEGPHMTGNVTEVDPDAVRVGMPVRVAFVPSGDGMLIPEWTPVP